MPWALDTVVGMVIQAILDALQTAVSSCRSWSIWGSIAVKSLISHILMAKAYLDPCSFIFTSSLGISIWWMVVKIRDRFGTIVD